MHRSSARKIQSRISIFLVFSITLLGIVNSAILVAGADYKNDKTPFYLFWNKPLYSISWSNSSKDYIACAWQDLDRAVNVGFISKNSFTIGKNFSSMQQSVTYPLHFSVDFTANPGVVYLDNGTIVLVLIMIDADKSNYNGVLEMQKANMSASWTNPTYLSVPGTLTVSNVKLMALNSSACAAFWEENNTIVYRILKSGYAWGPKQHLFTDFYEFNFCYRADGSLTMITCLPNHLIPSAIEFPRDPANWNQSKSFLLNYAGNGGEVTQTTHTYILTFQQNRYLYNTGSNEVFFHDESENKTSQEYSMQFNSTGAVIYALFKVDATRFIIFFNDNAASKNYYQFAENFDPFVPNPFSPTTIFIIVIVAIIGAQLVLFYISRRRKKNQANQNQQGNNSTEQQEQQEQQDENEEENSSSG